ncbi:hypothetical protein MTP03_09780 [Tsukamurella sp. PLM1]|nr:hypothetical protein MTP03_09780 [Tsukamurella sp. PLM1]
MQSGEHGFAAGPVLIEQGRELVDRRDPQLQLIATSTRQGLQLKVAGRVGRNLARRCPSVRA